MTEGRNGTIFAVRNDRLGGRLGAMLNAKRIADDYGARFRFTWSSHENVSPELQHPEMLFAEDFLACYREQDRTFGDLQQNVQGIESLAQQMQCDMFESQLAEGVDFRCNESMHVVTLPWEDKARAALRVTETLETISFTQPVIDAIRMIRSRLGDRNLVAYHVRRGDIIDPDARPSNVLWPNKYVSRVFYEAHILRILDNDPDTRIVVFSDSEHELSAFSEMSNRIIAASSLLSDDNLHILQRDFLELYIMSRCQRIIGPGASAFSSVAAMLGNSQIVDIRTDLGKEERDAALDELTYRLEHKPELFAGNADLGQNFPELVAYHRQQRTEPIARRILQKHLDAGFSQSYIYDLLAQEYFLAGDADGALNLIETMQGRPVLTDLGNSPSYAWAGLAALAAGNVADAARLAHVSHWLQPILPISRILISALTANGLFARDNHYPVPPQMVTRKPTFIDRFKEISKLITPALATYSEHEGDTAHLDFIPFELELRDWVNLQTAQLPAPFWNIPKQQKTISFFQTHFRRVLNDPAVMSILGQLYCQAGDDESGIALIEEAYQLGPEDAFTNLRLARLRLRENAKAEALALYDTAAELSEGQICFRAEQGLVRLKHGDKEGATEIFRDLAGIDHQMIELLILTADVLRRTGKYREEALQVALRADHLAPGAVRTTQILRRILEQLGRHKDAERIRTRLESWKRRPGKFSSRC